MVPSLHQISCEEKYREKNPKMIILLALPIHYPDHTGKPLCVFVMRSMSSLNFNGVFPQHIDSEIAVGDVMCLW